MNSREEIAEIPRSLLKAAGFKKSRLSWSRDGEEATEMISFQSSQWGDTYYCNLGVYYRALAQKSRPALQDCHYRIRLGTIVSEPAAVEAALDFERSNLTREDRAPVLLDAISEFALPWLESRATLASARARLRAGDPQAMVMVALRRHLGLAEE